MGKPALFVAIPSDKPKQNGVRAYKECRKALSLAANASIKKQQHKSESFACSAKKLI